MNQNMFEYGIEPWIVMKEQELVKTPIFTLYERTMRLKAGNDIAEGDFYILGAPAWINVLPVTEEGKIILVEQYRFGIKEPTLEIPGGMVDNGENPEETARRELLEETGYVSDDWKSLGKVSANPAIMSNFTHIFLAKYCRYRGSENPDVHERIKVHTLDFNKFLELTRDGTIHHAIVVAAVAKYLLVEQREKG